MILRGTDLTDIITTLYVTGRGPASQDVERVSIPNRPGSYFKSTRTPERIISVRFLIKGADMYELRTNLDEFNQLIYPDDLTDEERKKGYSLVFPDEPDMTYYGLPDGEPGWQEISDKGIGEINFVCFDPHKYGVEQSQQINDSSASSQSVVYNGGGKETYPIVEAVITKPTTFLSLFTPDKYLMLGAPITVDTTPIEREERLVNEGCGSLAGYSDGTYIDGGTVEGRMYSTGTVFTVSDFGSGPKWVGPAKKLALSEPLQDFRVNAYITVDSPDQKRIGRVEVYLLDVSNNVVGKMAMKDISRDVKSNGAEIRAGGLNDGHLIINRKNRDWTPFRHGILSIERVGTKFKAYVAQRKEDNTNKHYNSRTAYFNDVDLEYQTEVAQIQVHIGAYEHDKVPNMAIHQFEVYKINDTTEVEIPYIAQPGDVITIDHNTKDIRRNGEEFKWAKDFGSSLFALNKGENVLGVYPEDAADVTMKWRERWL